VNDAATITLSQLESHLWESANILRGPVDAADFKTYIFPLLFFKRICDVWDEDADLLEAVLSNPDPKKAKEIDIKAARRLRKHLGNLKFKALSERLDALRDRFESGVLNSVEFLKALLQIAKAVLQAEKEIPPEEDEDRGKAALTELFNEVKTAETPIMVERVVADIDEIVRLVRFPGWQDTLAGEREIKKALRKALFKYKLHADEDLFEKAYSYIRQYY